SASDPDGDAITLSATGVPAWAGFNTTTGLFSGTPGYTDSGSYNVTFTVSDGSLSASEVVTITVSNVNRSPVLNAIGAKAVNENVNLNFIISGSDPDGDAVTYSATGLPTGATFNTSTRVFDWTPTYSQSGSYNVTFTISDGSLSASEVVTISVSNVNRSPVLNAIGAKAVNEGSNLNFTVSGSDPDGDALTYSATGLPVGAAFNTTTGLFNWAPDYTQSGSYNVTFTVSDGSLSASEIVAMTVSNVNRVPVLNAIGAKGVNENINLNFTVSGSDPDGDAVTYSATGLPTGATFNTSTRVFDWTPSYSQSGSYNVTFTISDGSLSANEVVTITVSNVNRSPVLNAIGAKSVNENVNLNFTISGSDADGDTVTYSANGLPTGATFNTSTRVFDWTPSYSQSGSYNVTFTISDGSLSANEVVTITVSNVNRSPVLNAIGAKAVNEGINLNFTVSGSDPDGDAIILSASGLPTGASFNTITGVFDWTPSYSQSGSYNVTFTVSDGSLSVNEVVTITVTNVNRAPVLNPIGSKSIAEGNLLQFTVTASDPDGEVVTLSASNVPAWAGFNTTTGVFSGTPGIGSSGIYTVTFTASDGSLSSNEVVTITVANTNLPPVLDSIGAKGVNENSNLNFTISGSDPNGDSITFSATGVPSGATFNTTTKIFDWTPSYSQSGSYNVTFSVSDGLLSTSEVVTITVSNVNRSPVLNAIGAKGVNENVNLNFTISGSDPDGDTITYSATGLPSGATFNTTTRVFDWTPAYSQSGSYNVTFTVSDGLLTSTEVVTITVSNVNRSPVLNAIGAKGVNENINLNFTVSGSDPDGDAITLSATGLPAGATFNTTTGVFDWTPAYSQSGSYNVTFTISDGSLNVSEVVTITVSNVNRSPVLNAIGAKGVNENVNLNFTISGSDADGDAITYSATGLPAGAAFNTTTRVFDWTPAYSQSGSYNVTFTVSDGSLSSSEVVTITVNNVNQTPILNPIGSKSIAEGNLLQFTVTASDPDGDTLTLSATGVPAWGTFNTSTGLFSGTPGFGSSGTYPVTFTVSDGSLTSSEVVTITVSNTNQSPTLNTIGSKSANEGSNLNFTVSGSDPDGDPVSYSATGLPAGASFNTVTHVFDWTPSYSQSGSYNVTFTISDGSLSATEVVTITVNNVNRAPVLNSIGAKGVTENVNLNFTISGSDPDGDALTYSASGLPSGATFNTSTRVFDWTPAYSQSGSYNVTFTVSDGFLTSTEVVTITVSNVNRSPVLNAIGAKGVNENVSLNFTVSGSDPDGDTITLSATGLPSGAAFNISTGVFNWTPSYSQSGSYNVTFTISDGSLNASEVVNITVGNVNRAPVLNAIGAKSATENINLNFTVSGSDPDGDVITYSATGIPAGATFNTTTRVFDWTPTYSQSGSYNVTFTISDGSLSASEVVTVTVNNADRAPVLNPIGNKSTTETVLLQFTVTASDPDGDVTILSATGVPAWAGFNTTTGVFSGTPGYTDSGSYTVTFTAGDGTLSTSETITITVTNVNRSPVLNTIGAKSVNENVNLNFTISGSDPDGDPLTYSATGLPTGATFNTSTFNWTPTYSQSGSYNVTFTVSDGSLSSSEVVTITVADVNQAPVLNPVGNKSVTENDLLQFTVTASDPDGSIVTLSSTAAPSWATFNTTTGVFSGTPGYTDSGTYSMTFTASDGSLTSSETISITVSNANRPPVLNIIGAKSISEGSNLNFTISGSDPDTDPLTYSVAGLPSGATFNSSTRVFDWTPAYNQAGSYNITFTVSDGSLSDSEVVTISVTNVNRSPVLTAIGAKSVNENVNLNFTISANDPDGDPLTYSATGLPAGAAFNTATRVFNWTPSYTQSGSYNVTFRVTDGTLNSSEVVTITVNNVNQAPSAFAGIDQSVIEGANVTLQGTGSDADGDTVTYNWVQTGGTPVTINPANTAASAFTAPIVTLDDTLTFQLTVSDGSLNTVDSVNILVLNTTDADNDGYLNIVDCNDNDPLINPGALEILDGTDNNCNGTIDEGFDNDGDGFTTLAGDCNNSDASIYPNAPEVVDGKDNNCNSLIDDNTIPGLNVQVSADSSVNLIFAEVLTTGTTSVNTGTSGPVVPSGFRLPSTQTYYEIFTTSNFNGMPVTVCITYNELAFAARSIPEGSIRLFHWNGTLWDDITSAGYPNIAANKVCGVTLSFSPFVVVGEPSTSAGVYMGADSYNKMAFNTSNAGGYGSVITQDSKVSINQIQQNQAPADKSPDKSYDKKKNKVSGFGNINVTSTTTSSPARGEGAKLIPISQIETTGGGQSLFPMNLSGGEGVLRRNSDETSMSGALTNGNENPPLNKMGHGGVFSGENQRDKNVPPILNLAMDRRVPPKIHMDRRGFPTPPESFPDDTFYKSYGTDSPVNDDMSFSMNDGFGNEFSSRKLQNIQQEVNPSISGSVKDGTACLRWQYSGKAKGFFVQRADSRDRKFVRLQDSRLPVLDSNGVYEYVFSDHSITENAIYYYRIEIVDQEGHVKLTEPISLENMVSSVSVLE
ncbi:MAG: tandem-95 repeat protein, partial [Nitrospirae bacterium]|nr:tandem-95 repeat protein [Nitrospirota bacterium]